MRRTLLTLLTAVAMLVPLGGSAAADPPKPGSIFTADDTIHLSPDKYAGPLKFAPDEAPAALRTFGAAPLAAAASPTIGEMRNWLALDDGFGVFYRKRFTLRGIGSHVEIWVASERRTLFGVTASGTDFPDGDCRNGPRTAITDAQVAYLVGQFDNNILPKESVAFSVAPARDGTNAVPDPRFNASGPGGNTVVLVDNVRDDNFHDTNNTHGFSYIAGFFSSGLNNFFDRNIMTIDAFDWLHRTGATPPSNPVPGNNCTSAPARPFLYEGVFAHEYQHLLESYVDPDEVNWINEGLSDWAQTLTGYVTPNKSINDVGFDSHIQCFLGWLGVATPANPNPRAAGGPENSLTRWGDQGDGEILCDYGAAYSMMEFLAGRYGLSFMSSLHRGDANGIAGLQQALTKVSKKLKAMDVIHDWSLMVALDGYVDAGMKIEGSKKAKDVSTPTLNAKINWATAEAYSTAGAPSNGADYVRLRNAAGNSLSGSQIKSLKFQGSKLLPTKPVQWTVDASPPAHTGNPALYSGADNNRDEAIVKSISVPTGVGATLTFAAQWNEEETWDFGFAQISTDSGATYKSLTCTDTRTDTDPGALSTAKDNVPGYTGFSSGFRAQTCSLAAYAGATVLLAFRAFNDPSVLGTEPTVAPGFWVDDVMVGTTLISDGTSLTGWRSFSEVKPATVAGFTVHIININTRANKITVVRIPLTADFAIGDGGADGNINQQGNSDMQDYIDTGADFVGAVIFYDDPTETSLQYAPYKLTVNGVVQPGGGS